MDIDKIAADMVALSKGLSGHLKEREVAFLSCLPFISAEGEILEIGSFKGKSTIILSLVAKAAGMKRIVACDPLLLSSPTDPKDADAESLPGIFRKNLEDYKLSSFVEFHQKKSSDLAAEWNRPIKALWIDGDHTYEGASLDIELFSPFLVEGGIICLHDVLHGHDGPIRAFIDRVVLSEKFINCGCCASIGWGQYVGGMKISEQCWSEKLRLYQRLSRLVPYFMRISHGVPIHNIVYKLTRAMVPHGAISPFKWVDKMNSLLRRDVRN
ncbi:MAG TPA: class I SAM-dependent methyltransferase [Dissulfurispiraceae bacterium]|nr:class I SAM-dependent methyltransferase [Dissulfurispiraceae bacterium]